MTMYHIQWEIDLDANSPREAAERAMRLLRLPFTTATVFDVIEHDSDGESVRIDLEEEAS